MAATPDNEREALSAVASLLAKMAAKPQVARRLLDVYTRKGEQGLKEILEAFERSVAEYAERLPPDTTVAVPPAEQVAQALRLNIDPSALFRTAEPGTLESGESGTETSPAAATRVSTPAAERPVAEVAKGPSAQEPAAETTAAKGPAAKEPAVEQAVTEAPAAEEAPAEATGAKGPASKEPAAEVTVATGPTAGERAAEPTAARKPVVGGPARFVDDAAGQDRRPYFEPVQGAPQRPHHLRIPFDYDDDDVVYAHGVTIVPVDEKSESRPFMLEEKGLDSREFAFALDRGGLRFFLSRLDRRSISVSKTGLMLSGKQESLRLQGVHESVLNDLRAHGVVLPFIFGTIARSKRELLGLIDQHMYDLHDALDDLLATSWWKLTASMLDARLASIVGSEPGVAERERRLASRQTLPAAKMDIKMLEKILGRQKRIAEGVHEEMKRVADKAEVEMMVGFSSGTSDDWKPILRARYLVPPSRVHKFHRAITDIQYRHMLFELMLSLTGDQTAFALHPAR